MGSPNSTVNTPQTEQTYFTSSIVSGFGTRPNASGWAGNGSAGSFIGKGMYDVDAFEAATEPAFPDNRILSHDLIESNFARCALATDIELFDEFPARYHAYARRVHRWIRGDWQLLPWLFPTTPANPSFSPPGRRRNVLGIVERWKIFDNLRRSLVGPSVVVMAMLGWTVLPGSPWLWTFLALAVA